MSGEGVNWVARRAELADADGDEWDRLNAAFDDDWKAAYCKAFVEIALERGWHKDDAESWPAEIADEALLNADGHDYCPRRAAEIDVRECERECAP